MATNTNRFYLNNERQATPTLLVGETYTFNVADPRNAGYPLAFSTTPNGTFDGGFLYEGEEVEYYIGVQKVSYTDYVAYVNGDDFDPDSNPRVLLTPTKDTPSTLYYFSPTLSGMGGKVYIEPEVIFRANEGSLPEDREKLAAANEIEVVAGPRINSCCSGEAGNCLYDCIRQVESQGQPDDGCNARATDCKGCNGPESVPAGGKFDADCDEKKTKECEPGDVCDKTCRCGPYQISWNTYKQDICGAGGPCDQTGGTQYDKDCCEICTDPKYAGSICKQCNDPTAPGQETKDACCSKKNKRSKKLMDCWRRRYTRNNSKSCQCTGKKQHKYSDGNLPCCTCEDLARMHNGGNCAHRKNRKATDSYWAKVKKCMVDRKCNPEPHIKKSTPGTDISQDGDLFETGESTLNAGSVNPEITTPARPSTKID